MADPLAMTLGVAFYGYTIGAALFGITITQAYHYFMTKKYGAPWQNYIVAVILVLDTLHFGFAVHMMYTYLHESLGNQDAEKAVVWSLKAMGSVQVLFTIFVQALYLYKIWCFSRNPLLTDRFSQTLRAVVVFLSSMAIGVGVLFLIELQKVTVIKAFSLRFEYVIYVGFGATAFIDMGIACAMCLMLHKSSVGTSRSNRIIITLIQYIVGTGLLTSLGALLIMALYIAFPDSLLYLGIEYSMTRLYAISVLALYNSQSRLRDKLNETRDLQGTSMLWFAEPDKLISHGGTRSTPTQVDDRYDTPVRMARHSDYQYHNGHARHHNRSDTLDTLGSPDSVRPLTRMFEHLDAEDTLVERVHPAFIPMQQRHVRTASRHHTA